MARRGPRLGAQGIARLRLLVSIRTRRQGIAVITALAVVSALIAHAPVGVLANAQAPGPVQGVPVAFPDAGPTLLFVHGINAAHDAVGFNDLLGDILVEYPGRVVNFQYFQDLGYFDEDLEACIPLRPFPDVQQSDMPVDLVGSGSDICDSQSDHALNAVALHEVVQEIYGDTGRPLVLVSNSMGVAIVRGFLSYSAELEDGVAETMVDSLMFLQGAHDGSYLAPVANHYLDTLFGPLTGTPSGAARPAFKDLAPKSDWYNWANPDQGGLPDVPMYNVYGDLAYRQCVRQWFAGCIVSEDREQIGDGFVLPGTDSPFDVPQGGGARFLNVDSTDVDNWQWPVGGVGGDSVYEPFLIFGGPDAVWALQQPANHIAFQSKMDLLEVPDCLNGNPTPLDEELKRIIRLRMDMDNSYACFHQQGG